MSKTLSRSRDTQSRVPSSVTVTAYALVIVLLLVYGWVAMHALWSFHDDEGAMLASLSEWRRGGEPYGDFYLQYGPVWAIFWNMVASALGLELVHSTARIFTFSTWVLSATLIGVATRRLTRSHSATLASLVLSFLGLAALTREPLHPVGLLTALTAGLVAVTTLRESDRLRPVMIGLLVGLMALVKINIGVLAILAMLFLYSLHLPRQRVLVRWVAGSIVLLPAVWLVRSHLLLALLFTCAALSLLFQSSQLLRKPVARREIALTGLGLCTPVLVIVAYWWMNQWSIAGLIDGVVLRPLEHPQVYSIPLPVSGLVLALSAIVLILALSKARVNDSVASVVGLVGLAGGQVAAGVLLSTGPGSVASAPRESRAGAVTISVLAVFLFLGAFPVAGSQLAQSTLPFIPLISMLLLQASRDFLRRTSFSNSRVRQRVTRFAGLVPVSLAVAVMWPNTDIVKSFVASPSSSLPGLASVRLPTSQAEDLEKITIWMKNNCDMAVSDPGLRTLNLITGIPYPGRVPVGPWYRLLSPVEEERVISSIASAERPCLISDPVARDFWLRDQPSRATRLDQFLTDNFQRVGSIGRYQLSLPER